jgi:membrane-bound serine protease (ClpP class)
MAAWTVVLVRLVLRAQRRRASTGNAGIVGLAGTADTELSPEGWVRVQGEIWRAVSEETVSKGDRVRVTAIEGLTLRVRKEA